MNKLLDPIKYVVDHSDDVSIDSHAISQYVQSFVPAQMDHWMKACPFSYSALPNQEEEITRWFLQDALAYCFWGYPAKWTVEYQGQKIDGWWALLASIQRALDDNVPLTDAAYLAQINSADLSHIFRGTPTIPLFETRLHALRQIGEKLVKDYKGKFVNFLHTAPKNAQVFTASLADTFPIYNDISEYKNQKIYFYKKAQLFVHDLITGFPDNKYSQIVEGEMLIGEADYKIPALLRHFGILVYSNSLASRVDNRSVLLADSKEEIEIRAGMLWACHLICKELKNIGITIDATTLDGILWVQSQSIKTDKPYHLTLTTDY